MMTSKNKVVLLLSCCLLFSYQAFATTFTVNTTLDAVDSSPGNGVCATTLSGSPCSLRAAIMEANAYANTVLNGEELPDIINLPNGVYRLTISGRKEDLSAKGDLDITDHLIINGNSADKNAVVIDASSASDRVIHILSSNKVIKVELNYLSITGGYGTDPRAGGGGICIICAFNDGGSYLPADLGETDPVIVTIFEPIDGVFNSDISRPEVILRHVDIYSNYDVVSGPGIMSGGVLTIEDSVIRNNNTSYVLGNTTNRFGSFNRGNSQFSGGGMGGAITNMGGKLTILRTIISGNRAQIGGAIFSQDTLAQFRDEQVIIEDSQITGNRGFMGGAIFNISGIWDYAKRNLLEHGLVIRNSTIDNNRAEFTGGGIYNMGLGAIQLSNVTVSNNSAQYNGWPPLQNKGGGIYHSGKIMDIVNTTITNNFTAESASNDGSSWGGWGGGWGGGSWGGSGSSWGSWGRGGGAPTPTGVTGGDEIYLDVTEANTDPQTDLPWRFSIQNTIIGNATSTDACNGTAGFDSFIVNIGGNVDDSNTCVFTAPIAKPSLNAKLSAKPNANASAGSATLGMLTNNGGIAGNELPDGTFPPTLALLAGNAINSGIDCNANDQRGFGRDTATCDPGAFQSAANTKGGSNYNNNLPIARNDHFVKAQYEKIAIPLTRLLANDNDPLQRGVVVFDEDSVQMLDQNSVSAFVGKGSQAENASMIDFLYLTPISGLIGETSFSYRVSIEDSTTNQPIYSEAATVTVEITDQNLPPIAHSQTFIVSPGETFDSTLNGSLFNSANSKASYDPEQKELQYIIGTEPLMGTVTINSDGDFSYIANADASGSDGFTYAVVDPEGLRSRPASVSIYFNTSILTSAENPTVSVAAGKIANIDLLGNTSGDFQFSLQPDLAPEQGTIIWLDENSGKLLYHANETALNADTIGFSITNLQTKLSEGEARSLDGTANITILPAAPNNAPVASAMDLSIDIEIVPPEKIYLTANDVDNDALFYQIIDKPETGEITEFDPAVGSLVYSPDTSVNASGKVSFTFTVFDGLLESPPATVNIDFPAQVNIVPIATEDTAITPSDMSISINVLSNDTDANGDNLQVSIDSSNTREGGTVSVNSKGIVQYTPPDNFIGEDLIDYHIDDGQGGTASAALKVAVIAASEDVVQSDLPDTPDQGTDGGLDTNGSSDNGNVIVSNGTSASSLSWLLLLSLGVLLLKFRSSTLQKCHLPASVAAKPYRETP